MVNEKEKNGTSLIKKLFIEETNNTFIQFFRSLFVGGAATVVDIIALIICREIFHAPESIAAAVGFVFGVTVNYIISTLWVFAKAKVDNRTKDFIFFVIIGIIVSIAVICSLFVGVSATGDSIYCLEKVI